MFYILHGDDDFTRTQEVANLRGQIAQDGMGDLNIAQLDGRKLSLTELKNACDTIPFLTDRRLVIVEGFLSRMDGRSSARSRRKVKTPVSGDAALAEELETYLPNLPETTRLVFVETQTLSRTHPLIKAASQISGGYVREFKLPGPSDLQQWIARQAQKKGVEIERAAASALAEMVGSDLWTLDRDLEKLAGYAGYERPIHIDDVQALVSAAQEADIFAFVDSLGLKQGRQALALLHRLLSNGAADLYLLTMVARQVRLILAAKELAEEQKMRRPEIQKALRISHPFIVDKLIRQAQQFEMEELVDLMARILDTDEAIKTGRVEGTLGLELLTLEMCQKSRSRIR